MALIGEDCQVALKLGTVSGGVVTWDGNGATIISGKARRVTTTDSVELSNTKGLGDARKLHRAHSGSTRLEIERLVGYSGYYAMSGRATRIGDAAQVQILEYSGLSTSSVFTGIIESWEGDIQSGEAQLEKITIMCDIDASYS